MHKLNNSDLYKCSGCSVCLVNCPSFKEGNDSFNSAKGRLMALKWGADVDTLKESIESCKDCSLCAEVCPEDIDLFSINRHIAKNISGGSFKEVPSKLHGVKENQKVFIGGCDYGFLNDYNVINLDGEFLKDGCFDEDKFISNIVEPLRNCSSIVTDNYRLLYYAKRLGKLNNIKGLGELLVDRATFNRGDLFVPSFYGLMWDYKKLFHYYDDEVRVKGGANLFVDLNRMPFYIEGFEASAIENMVLISTKGAEPKRIVLEDKNSIKLFTSIFKDCEIIFIGDLINE